MTGADAPWMLPLDPWPARVGWGLPAPLDLLRLNRLAEERCCRSGSGRRLRFVSASDGAMPGAGYERLIFDEGSVSTRLMGRGAIHDFANALAWLAFPRLKASLNTLHVEALSQAAEPGRRGALRDRATLLDESGALVLCEAPHLAASLRGFRWHELFVDYRADWPGRIRVVPVGHGLFEKLRTPYKALCAQAWVLVAPPSLSLDEIDALAAQRLCVDTLGELTPLPLMGIPGWSSASEDPAFYNDPQVFRSGKLR